MAEYEVFVASSWVRTPCLTIESCADTSAAVVGVCSRASQTICAFAIISLVVQTGCVKRMSLKENAGVEDAGRVEALLDPAKKLDLGGVVEFEEVARLRPAEPMLAGDRTAPLHRERENVGEQFLSR